MSKWDILILKIVVYLKFNVNWHYYVLILAILSSTYSLFLPFSNRSFSPARDCFHASLAVGVVM